MSELRKDPILDQWVIIAAERGRRPHDFAVHEHSDTSASGCPFCAGNEDMTPPEVYSVPAHGEDTEVADWLVRVVPNKFPALSIEGDVKRSGIGYLDRMTGVGAHEVIIETPTHSDDLSILPNYHATAVINTYIQRLTDLRSDERFRHIVLFRNYGSAAGASLEHPHSQLIALPIVPRLVKSKLEVARNHFQRKERCIFCDLIEQELAVPDRVVMKNEHFVVLSVFAARSPFEVNVYPLRHQHDITLMTEDEKVSLASILKEILQRYREILGDPAYNMIIQTAPNMIPRPGRPDYWGTIQYDYHWHIELMPRVTKIAGFEWGTGFYINPVAPEDAATYLRGEEPEAVETAGH